MRSVKLESDPRLRAFFDQAETTFLNYPYVVESTGGIDPVAEITEERLNAGSLASTTPRHVIQICIGEEPARAIEVAGWGINSIEILKIRLGEWFAHEPNPDEKTGPVLRERVASCMDEIRAINQEALSTTDTISGLPRWQDGSLLEFAHWAISFVVTPIFVIEVMKALRPIEDSHVTAEGLYHARAGELRAAYEAHYAKEAAKVSRRNSGGYIM